MLHIPYTYLIGWPNHNKWYYGVRYAKNCNPSDLWVTYKTSSKYVRKFVEQCGDPPVIQVRKTFTDVDIARKWETKVLTRMSVVGDDKWLNKSDVSSIDPKCALRGEQHWTFQNTKHANNWSGDKNPMKNPNTIAKVSGNNHYTHQPDYDNSNHNRPMNRKEVRDKVSGDNHYTHQLDYDNSTHQAKRPQSRERMRTNNPSYRPEVIAKKRVKMLGHKFPRIICEHCNKEVSINQYPKWHGNKCKLSSNAK